MLFRIRNDEFLAAVDACFFGRFHFLQRIPAILCKKIFRIGQFDPVALGEFLSAGPNHHDMLRFFHDGTCQDNRIANMLDSSNRARGQRFPIHDRGIHFVCARAGKN